MDRILPFLEEQVGGVCYRSYKYCVDEREVPSVNYEENQEYTLQRDRYGETDTSLKTTKDISKTAKQIEGNRPLFRYFLDGSRRIYKIDDIELGKKIFPIIGGQIGVACCERINPSTFKKAILEHNLVLSLPETFILFRFFFEKEGFTDEWWKSFNSLSSSELNEAKRIIHKNDFKNLSSLTENKNIIKVLQYYT